MPSPFRSRRRGRDKRTRGQGRTPSRPRNPREGRQDIMKPILIAAAAALFASAGFMPARAWMRGGERGGWSHATVGGAGGFSHGGAFGGWAHNTTVSPGGVSHTSDAGGYMHNTTASASGISHTGAYGNTTVNSSGDWTHTDYYGTTSGYYGGYYHAPPTVNYYAGSGCWNCGAGYWGAAAAGAAVGTAVGVAAGAAATSNAYAAGYAAGATRPVAYAVLPAGCTWMANYAKYDCNGMWLQPAYGANGLYYMVVATP